MKFPNPIAVRTLAEEIGAKLIGNDQLEVTGINEIHQVQNGDVTFVDHPKYFKKSLHSDASVIIINAEVDCPVGKALLVCSQPFEAYNQIVLQRRPVQHLTAAISDTAEIHPSAIVEPHAIIGQHVKIGANSRIHAHAVIHEYSELGEGVEIQSAAIIGSDAFYFKKTEEGYQAWRSGGRAIIEDGVRISAGCTINKGVSGDTIIGAGSMLDCQVHIGHDVVVGKRCLFAAQVGIGGNTVVEDEVVLYGQVGIAQNLRIGAKSVVLAKSGVSKDLEGGKVYFGYPAKEARVAYKELAALRHLPEFYTDFYNK